MGGRWAHNRFWDPRHEQQYREECERAARIKAQQEEYEHFCSVIGDQPLAGHYRNFLGAHFEVTYTEAGELQVRRPPLSETQEGPGTQWLPLTPNGNTEEPYVWQCRPEEARLYVQVMLVHLGVDDVHHFWSTRFQSLVWVVQNRPAHLINHDVGLLYSRVDEPCKFDEIRPCFVMLDDVWVLMTPKVKEDMGLYYVSPAALEQPPVPDVHPQAPAENWGGLQNEGMAPQLSLPGTVNQDGAINVDDFSALLPGQQQIDWSPLGPLNSQDLLAAPAAANEQQPVEVSPTVDPRCISRSTVETAELPTPPDALQIQHQSGEELQPDKQVHPDLLSQSFANAGPPFGDEAAMGLGAWTDTLPDLAEGVFTGAAFEGL